MKKKKPTTILLDLNKLRREEEVQGLLGHPSLPSMLLSWRNQITTTSSYCVHATLSRQGLSQNDSGCFNLLGAGNELIKGK